MKKILLVILALTALAIGAVGCDNSAKNNDQPNPFADFLVRKVYNSDGNKFYTFNNKGEDLREIAENILDKRNFTPISKTKALLSASNKLYISTDGWNTFNEIFTPKEIENHTITNIIYSYAGNGMISVTTQYRAHDGTNKLLSQFDESYDNGANWMTLQVDENITTSFLSRTVRTPESYGAHNLKNVIRYTYSETTGDKYYIIDNKGDEVREIAGNIPNKSDLRIMDDKTAYLTAGNTLYRSDDGYNTFASIFTIPDVQDYTFGRIILYPNAKDFWFYAYYTPSDASGGSIFHDYVMDSNNAAPRKVEIQENGYRISPEMDGAVLLITKDNVSISTDKGLTFTPFFTPDAIPDYTVNNIATYYSLQGVAGVQVGYLKTDSTGNLNRYYETYDNGKTWTPAFENISSAALSRPYFYE